MDLNDAPGVPLCRLDKMIDSSHAIIGDVEAGWAGDSRDS